MHIVFKEGEGGGGSAYCLILQKLPFYGLKMPFFGHTQLQQIQFFDQAIMPYFWALLSPDSWVHIVRCDVVPLIPMKGASADNGDG